LGWLALLREHNAIVRAQIAQHGGFEVKTIGDAFMVAFGSARRALLCAIGIQQAMAEVSSSPRGSQGKRPAARSSHPR
jgi:class 3 adenylate cyclase